MCEDCREDEAHCAVCDVVIIYDPEREVQRCDGCQAHHDGTCGDDCPIVGCENAREDPGPGWVDTRTGLHVKSGSPTT